MLHKLRLVSWIRSSSFYVGLRAPVEAMQELAVRQQVDPVPFLLVELVDAEVPELVRAGHQVPIHVPVVHVGHFCLVNALVAMLD